jgi:hypothetical protein
MTKLFKLRCIELLSLTLNACGSGSCLRSRPEKCGRLFSRLLRRTCASLLPAVYLFFLVSKYFPNHSAVTGLNEWILLITNENKLPGKLCAFNGNQQSSNSPIRPLSLLPNHSSPIIQKPSHLIYRQHWCLNFTLLTVLLNRNQPTIPNLSCSKTRTWT